MGYEVDEATLDAYAQHLLQAPVDEKVSTESSKELKAPSSEPTNPKPTKSVKRKQKADRQYMSVSLEETESDEEIKEVPKLKGVFARVVGEKKEEKKKELAKEPNQKTPKITMVHKQKPNPDEQSKLEEKRRISKKKLDAQDIIDQIINDGNLDNIFTFFSDFSDKDKKRYQGIRNQQKIDEQNINIDPPVSTPSVTIELTSESNFETEDTPTENVQDIEANIGKQDVPEQVAPEHDMPEQIAPGHDVPKQDTIDSLRAQTNQLQAQVSTATITTIPTTTTTTTTTTTSTAYVSSTVSITPPPLVTTTVTSSFVASQMPAPTMTPITEIVTIHDVESDSDQDEVEPTPKKVEPKKRKILTPSSVEK
ncbi:uncharacterized protein LOC131859479 [Cryptomeria japonica]|uniref:uncharacterized protein LOC131859479 n=1 Tax=Cryptomeria japonica TaxID=3369 RepID=UPI0027D9FF87|nr:uncharacterized protein LOC131859479 [Cryptomeria japonica]